MLREIKHEQYARPVARSGRARGIARRIIPLTVCLASFLACVSRRDPQAAFDHARQTFQHGDLALAQQEAEKGYADFHETGSDWAWKFKILEADAMYWRGMSDSVLKVLSSEPSPPSSGELAVQKQRLEGLAYASSHKFPEAELKLGEAERICASSDYPACGELARARGRLEMMRGRFAQAQGFYEEALTAARARGNRFSEATALLNLSWSALEQAHFDEALDWSEDSRQISVTQEFAD